MARVNKKKNGKFVIVNELYEEIPIEHVDMLFNFHNDIATFRVKDGKTKKYGYINALGKKITSNVYDHAEDFGENYGLVKLDNYQNLIDRDGNEIFDWKYKAIYPFLKETFIVKNQNDYYGLVNIKDEIIIGFYFEDLMSITHEARHLFENWPTKVGLFSWHEINKMI